MFITEHVLFITELQLKGKGLTLLVWAPFISQLENKPKM